METEESLVTKNNDECIGEPHIGVVWKEEKNDKKRKTRQKFIRAMFDGFVLLFLGMQISQKGPSFLDLQLISGTSVEGASSYFTANSFGYMVGALVAGFLYDKINNKMLIVCLPLTLSSFFTALTPWCTVYVTMVMAHMASAFWAALYEITVTADQFPIWKGKSEAAIQFLAFTYSFGGVLGPLYTEPFLVPKWNETADSRSMETSIPFNNSIASLVSSQLDYNGENQTNQTNAASYSLESELHYAYMITGLFGVLFSIPYYVMSCIACTHGTKKKHKKDTKDITVNIIKDRLTRKQYVLLTVIICVEFFFFSMTEESFNMFLFMFVVSHLSWRKENGALISSLYWAIGTISKMLAIPIVRKVDLGIILTLNVLSMTISIAGFVVASHYRNDIFVWISCSAFSMTQASFYGGFLSWVDTEIVHLDGKATSCVYLATAAGAMFGPLILGITMDLLSLMVFTYFELINSLITTILFVYILLFLKPYVYRKFGPVRYNIELAQDGNKIFVDDDNTCNPIAA